MAEDNRVCQRVLEIVKQKGPVVPSQVSVEIGTSSLIVSAILSELASGKQIRISSVKIGGSPLYYAPGQEEKLQNYVKYLHEKEVKAYELLKSKMVLQDEILEPVMRVALREIKDFALPLNVQTPDGGVKLFWKWYMLSNGDAEPYINDILEGGIKKEAVVQKKEAVITVMKDVSENAKLSDVQETLRVKKPKKAPADSGIFVRMVLDYFSHSNIEVLERFESKRRAEAEFVVSVPSPVGSIKYYCRAKDKKSCNDADLSSAYVRGQAKKLPVLFLTSGKLTKNATEMLEREFSAMKVKKI